MSWPPTVGGRSLDKVLDASEMLSRSAFLAVMDFPPEWESWEMLPSDYLDDCIRRYEPGDEAGSEHDRHGVFAWWLRNASSPADLAKLARLTWLDPDPVMARSVRDAIGRHALCVSDVSLLLRQAKPGADV